MDARRDLCRATVKDKTKNNWKDRANFVQKGLYSMVTMDGNDADDTTNLKRASKPAEAAKKKKKSKNEKSAVSELEPRVQAFVKKIFDEDSMNESLKRQNIDVKKSARLDYLCPCLSLTLSLLISLLSQVILNLS